MPWYEKITMFMRHHNRFRICANANAQPRHSWSVVLHLSQRIAHFMIRYYIARRLLEDREPFILHKQYSAVPLQRCQFSLILSQNTPKLAREGEVWGVFCEFNLWRSYIPATAVLYTNNALSDRFITAFDCTIFADKRYKQESIASAEMALSSFARNIPVSVQQWYGYVYITALYATTKHLK